MYSRIREVESMRGIPSGVDQCFGLGLTEGVQCVACGKVGLSNLPGRVGKQASQWPEQRLVWHLPCCHEEYPGVSLNCRSCCPSCWDVDSCCCLRASALPNASQVTRQAHYTQHFVTVHAASLRAASAQLADAGGGQAPPLGQLLRLVEEQSAQTCDVDAGKLPERPDAGLEGCRTALAVQQSARQVWTVDLADTPPHSDDFCSPSCRRRLRRPGQAVAAAGAAAACGGVAAVMGVTAGGRRGWPQHAGGCRRAPGPVPPLPRSSPLQQRLPPRRHVVLQNTAAGRSLLPSLPV